MSNRVRHFDDSLKHIEALYIIVWKYNPKIEKYYFMILFSIYIK